MLIVLLLSLSLQTAPAEALEQERCLRTLQALDARVNRSALVDRRYMHDVQQIARIQSHTYRHGPWPGGQGPLGAPDVTAEQSAEIRREVEASDTETLGRRLDECLARYPVRTDD